MLARLMEAHGAGQLTFFNTHAGLADKRTFKRLIAPLRHIALLAVDPQKAHRTRRVRCGVHVRTAAPE